MIVAGLGFRHGVTAEELLETLGAAVRQAAVELGDVQRLATLASRSEEAGFIEMARRLSVAVDAIPSDKLAEEDGRLATHSARIAALHGVGSVCEAAALAAAGPGGRLRLPRITGARTACALAEGPGR
jgi:cobalt-precorrin 5A hydrolase